MMTGKSYETFLYAGLALDPIHVGTGGNRLGRVDNTIVRDPVTQIPVIPGSSLAGVMRAYTAMEKGKYPDCAGLDTGHPESKDQKHCGLAGCPVCTVFGFARKDASGGFAGLAAFSDIQILLFPVASQLGPRWLTCPMVLRQVLRDLDGQIKDLPADNAFYCQGEGQAPEAINLGWIYLPVRTDWDNINETVCKIKDFGVPDYITQNLGIVSDKLFSHIVNSNLEVRTSVAINPETGAAEDKALFTYEAIPRWAVLAWEITCRNPKHFKIKQQELKAVEEVNDVRDIIKSAFDYLEHLGIGGMGSRGMGRLRVFNKEANNSGNSCETVKKGKGAS